MTTQTSEVDQVPEHQISTQCAAFEALAAMAQMFSTLPAGYASVFTPIYSAPEVQLQLKNPQAFEQWRVALQIAPADVDLFRDTQGCWLATDGVFRGVEIHMTGFGLPVTPEQAAEQRTADATAVTA